MRGGEARGWGQQQQQRGEEGVCPSWQLLASISRRCREHGIRVCTPAENCTPVIVPRPTYMDGFSSRVSLFPHFCTGTDCCLLPLLLLLLLLPNLDTTQTSVQFLSGVSCRIRILLSDYVSTSSLTTIDVINFCLPTAYGQALAYFLRRIRR